MIELKAGGGVFFRKMGDVIQVVLIKRNGVWDLPKGKKEEGEIIKLCARREVAEEVGIALPDITAFLTKTYHTYRREGKKYGKTTHWYKMDGDGTEKFIPQRQEGITEVVWVDVDEALNQVGYANLKKVLQVFKKSFA